MELRRPIVGRVFTPIYGANYGQSETNGAREKKQPPEQNHARSTRRVFDMLNRLSAVVARVEAVERVRRGRFGR